MRLYEKTFTVPVTPGNHELLASLDAAVAEALGPGEVPIRIAMTKTDAAGYHVELGILPDAAADQPVSSVFDFNKRPVSNATAFNAVLVIPTGIGAELGGHSGDGGPLAVLMSSVCDTLITHPNVVNASDINELPQNGLYVEGSVIARLLMGTVGLQKVRANRVILVIDDHPDPTIAEHAINAASAARAALGLECPLILKLENPVRMITQYAPSGRAVGRVEGLEGLVNALCEHEGQYDAIALSSRIQVPRHYHHEYYLGDMVNPWGGVEAMLTHAISSMFNLPSAHAPMMESQDIMNLTVGVVDPRMAAEVISVTYLHSVLKGLHRSPRLITDCSLFSHSGVISASDISCLVIPDGCVGLPTLAALEQGIPVIAVRENKNLMRNDLSSLPFQPGGLHIVDNYLEAIGVICALKSGVSVGSVRRPLSETRVLPELKREFAPELGNVFRLRSR